MAHYTGPKARINRRLGIDVYDSSGAVRASRRRPFKPGMHPWRRRKLTPYGLALMEKQTVRHYYGLSEKQLRRFFAKSSRKKGNKGENLLLMCERRMDNVLWRAGFAKTRAQARQAVAHGHFMVNGVRCKVPSRIVRAEDVIAVRGRDNLKTHYTKLLEEIDRDIAEFLAIDKDALTIKITRLPVADEISLPVDINQVVEFLSR
ncbi:MAG: 30S ribosomal protein S4 [Planctomycetota bacterium]